MRHVYTVCRPKLCLAKATNKCRCCGRGIKKGETYALILFLDKCLHSISNRRIGMHEKIKLCRECIPALLKLEARENLTVPVTFKEHVHEMVAQYGIRRSRYDIARGVDVMFTHDFSEPMKEFLKDRMGVK